MINPTADIVSFFEDYANAFSARDIDRLADLFTYPGHVVSDAGQAVLVPVPSRELWIPRLADLLSMYGGVGFAKAVVGRLDVKALSTNIVWADVHWELRNAVDALLYDFDTCYTVVRTADRWQIAQAISSNELAHYKEFLIRRG